MFDTTRYSINYIHQCLIKDDIEPPIPDRSGDNLDALKALYEAHKAGGSHSAKKAWEVLKKAVPHLNRRQKLISFNDLHLIERPQYALPVSEDGTAPPYALYLGGLNTLYGQPGSGKSFVAIDFCKRLSLAYPDRAIIFSAGEGVSGLSGRSAAWDKHFGSTPENLLLWDEAVPMLNEAAVEEFIANIEPLKPLFVVVDTLARSMDGENENDTSVMSNYIKATEELMRRLDCGVLLIHHTGRGGFIRGSSVLDGACDSMLKLQANDNRITVFNSLEHGGKNKHNPEVTAIQLVILPVEVSINEEKFSEAVVIMSDMVIDDVVDDKLSDNQRIILELLFDIGEPTTASQIIESLDIHRATVFRNLKMLEKAECIQKSSNGIYTITETGIQALGV